MRIKPKVVLDTNVLLVSISPKSKYHWIFQKLLAKEYSLCVTTEILMEYQEIIEQKYDKQTARDLAKVLFLMPNVEDITVYYNWNLIENDPDDNKFIDCAIAGNAHVLVTHDKHFDIVKRVDFPKIQIVNTSEFSKILSLTQKKGT